MADNSSSWEDSSEEEEPAQKKDPAKQPAKKDAGKKKELKMRNADAESWEESESEQEPEPVKKPAPKAKAQKKEWDDDSESEELVQKGPKSKSTNKTKLLRDKLRARELRNKEANDYDDDVSSEDIEEPNTQISERNLNNKKGNAMLFGEDRGVKKIKRKKITNAVPKSLRDLFPVNAQSRLEAGKDLGAFSNAVSSYILDLSLGGVDQSGNPVKPVISPNQAKNFVCTVIAKSCESLDFTQLADIRRQVDSQMTKFRNDEVNARKAKRRGGPAKKTKTRKIFVEKNEDPVYVDGSYNDTDFDAFY